MPQSVNYLDPLMKVGRQIIGETKKRRSFFGEQTRKAAKLFASRPEKQAGGARMQDSLQGMGLRTKLRISIRLNYPVAWRAVCFY